MSCPCVPSLVVILIAGDHNWIFCPLTSTYSPANMNHDIGKYGHQQNCPSWTVCTTVHTKHYFNSQSDPIYLKSPQGPQISQRDLIQNVVGWLIRGREVVFQGKTLNTFSHE